MTPVDNWQQWKGRTNLEAIRHLLRWCCGDVLESWLTADWKCKLCGEQCFSQPLYGGVWWLRHGLMELERWGVTEEQIRATSVFIELAGMADALELGVVGAQEQMRIFLGPSPRKPEKLWQHAVRV